MSRPGSTGKKKFKNTKPPSAILMIRKRGWYILLLLFILSFPLASAVSVDEQISQVVSYAEQYEIGQMEYLELLVQVSLVRDEINELLGSFSWDEYAPPGITPEAAEQYFGIPTGYTKHAWDVVVNEETRLDEQVPWFERIVLDGKRVQVIFHAWPHIYSQDGEETLYYWTDFEVRFKKEVDVDFTGAVDQIRDAGTAYFEGAGGAEEVSLLMVQTERRFWDYVEQNKENCESVMGGLFPSDALVEDQEYTRSLVTLYDGENLMVTLVASFPECDTECNWPWISLWFEPEVFGDIQWGDSGGSYDTVDREQYNEYTIEQLEDELRAVINDASGLMERVDQGEVDWGQVTSLDQKMNVINEMLNERYYHPAVDQKAAYEERRTRVEDIISEFGDVSSEVVQEKRYEQRLVVNAVEQQDAWCMSTTEERCDSKTDACIGGACVYALGGDEDCENGVDDDGDTVVDCGDPDCAVSCGRYCTSACNGPCWDCHGECQDTCNQCWNCDWETNGEACGALCESSGCNQCIDGCNSQSFCAECVACEEGLYGIKDCSNECDPCGECQSLYTTPEEADANCAVTCEPCTACLAPDVASACYETCDVITDGSLLRDSCYRLCDDNVLFSCNGVLQNTPCLDTTYICDGSAQPLPCTIYTCPTEYGEQKQTVPCGSEECGVNQAFDGYTCSCLEGYYDCNGEGSCTDTQPCGLGEVCTDSMDNDDDQLVDCQDLAACDGQPCGEGAFCFDGWCAPQEEIVTCPEGDVFIDGVCRQPCGVQEDCSVEETCAYGYCSFKQPCTAPEDCPTDHDCLNGFCEERVVEEDLISTGESCALATDCSGQRDICSEGVCKEIPLEAYDELISEGLIFEPLPEVFVGEEEPLIEEELIEEFYEEIEEGDEEEDGGEEVIETLTGFITRVFSTEKAMGYAISDGGCASNTDCSANQECDTFSGNCYCGYGYFDCNYDLGDGCESTDVTCGGTREIPECGENQEFDAVGGYCKCVDGYFDCDGLWWACESKKECDSCTGAESCASASCAPYDQSVVLNFGCFNGSTWTEEKGVLSFSGGCTSYPTGKVDPWVHFNAWGEPFEELNSYRSAAEETLGQDWCDDEYNNALRHRTEIERSLQDPAFVERFFSRLLEEDPDQWQKEVEAIYTMYWSIVDNTRRLAESSECLDVPFPELTPITVSYDSEGGGIELWEESSYVNEFSRDILTPYMKLWVFPPKEMIKEEFQRAAEEERFPGPEGEGGPTVEDLEAIRTDPDGMAFIRELVAEYDDKSLDTKIVIDDDGEQLFIIDYSISEENLIQVIPVTTYDKIPDVTVTIDFDFMYNFIKATETDPRTESPEWVDQSFEDTFDDVVDAGFTSGRVAVGFATGAISVSPVSKMGTAVKLLQMMFEEGP